MSNRTKITEHHQIKQLKVLFIPYYIYLSSINLVKFASTQRRHMVHYVHTARVCMETN